MMTKDEKYIAKLEKLIAGLNPDHLANNGVDNKLWGKLYIKYYPPGSPPPERKKIKLD